MHMNKLVVDLLVMPREAINISRYRGIDDVYICGELIDEWLRAHAKQRIERDDFPFLMACVWNAGRVQGVREERLKRHGKKVKIPVLNIPMISDYEWQQMSLQDRLEHPEKYEKTEDVQATIAHLRQWLEEHKPSGSDIK